MPVRGLSLWEATGALAGPGPLRMSLLVAVLPHWQAEAVALAWGLVGALALLLGQDTSNQDQCFKGWTSPSSNHSAVLMDHRPNLNDCKLHE